MSAEDRTSDTRTIDESGTQREPEGPVGGGRSSRGPALSTGGDQEPGGAVPPYEGRKESAEIEDEGDRQGGVRVGGAAHPVADDEAKAPDPASTPGGATASPADEQPAAETRDGTSRQQGSDTGSHVPGVPRGEDSGA